MPNEKPYSSPDAGSLNGKLALVTGAYGGIGAHTVQGLARAGFSVILAGRDPAKLERQALAVRSQVPGAAAETLILDLGDLASVQQAAEKVLASGRPLDVLVNNAAVIGGKERRTTKDEFELVFGTNHLGHYALTGRLLPALLAAPSARVVTVSAVAARSKSISLADPNSDNGYKGGLRGAYAKSKLANLVFTCELARRAEDTSLKALAVHPGIAPTGLLGEPSALIRWVGEHLISRIANTPEEASGPSLYAATHDDIPDASFIGPVGRMGISGPPAIIDMPALATDPDLGLSLWTTSEELTHVHYTFSQHPSPRA